MVNVIGLGYIGLPTALMMASHGVEVVGTDYNKDLVETLKGGHTTFKEEGLDDLFRNALDSGIRFTTEYQRTDMYIVSVPTPYDKFSKKVDACYVVAAVREIMKVCPKGATVVIESTVSPGTIDKFVRPVIAEGGFEIGRDIHLVHAPERIIPGNMVYELLHNNRTIGADSREVGEKVKEYYSSFCQGEIVVTDIRSAEMSKVVENTFRAVNIAFANELSRICRHDNMDVYEIIRICNMHPPCEYPPARSGSGRPLHLGRPLVSGGRLSPACEGHRREHEDERQPAYVRAQPHPRYHEGEQYHGQPPRGSLRPDLQGKRRRFPRKSDAPAAGSAGAASGQSAEVLRPVSGEPQDSREPVFRLRRVPEGHRLGGHHGEARPHQAELGQAERQGHPRLLQYLSDRGCVSYLMIVHR